MSILLSKPHISSSGAVTCNEMTVSASSSMCLPMLGIRLHENRSVIGDIMAKIWVKMRLKKKKL
jgi:hypothetical protein